MTSGAQICVCVCVCVCVCARPCLCVSVCAPGMCLCVPYHSYSNKHGSLYRVCEGESPREVPLGGAPNAIPDAKEWNVFLTPPPLSN